MTKTYAQVMKQIDSLAREADKLKRKEADGVVARIKEAIAAYGLSATDLGLGGKRGPKPGTKRAGKKKMKKPGKPVVRFRDESGNSWIGRGPRPQWLRDALAAGKSVSDFAV
ncbi:MAG: H-NS histone family protein [Rubrivivax sp.]